MPATERWSQRLIYFILAVLPLERIPSLDVLLAGQEITVRLSQIGGLLLILINLPLLWRQRRRWLAAPWRWLMLFLVAAAGSSLLALRPQRALLVLTFLVFLGLLAFVIAAHFQAAKIKTYITILLVSALATTAFAFFQFFGDLLNLPISITGLREQYTKALFGFPRVQSTGLEPLYYANYLLIPVALSLVFALRKPRYLLISLPLLTIIWMALSRGAYAATLLIVAAIAAYSLMKRRWRAAITMVGVAAASVLLAIGLISFAARVDTKPATTPKKNLQNLSRQSTNLSYGESAEGRAATRWLAWEAFKANPALGIGPGNFGTYANQQVPSRFTDQSTIANNETLELLAEHGALGFAFFALFAAALLRQSLRRLKLRSQLQLFTLGLLLALAATVVQYQTFSTLYITHIWVTLGLLAGAAQAKIISGASAES